MRPPLTSRAIDSARERMVAIATRLFRRGGVTALSLRRLATAAGMSRSTPYGYFKNKQEIVDAIRAAGFDRLTARVAAALAPIEDPLLEMRALGESVVRFACDEPDVYRLMFGGPVFTDGVAPVLARAVERFRAVSRPPLDRAARKGLVRGDPDALRRVTWAAFHGLVSLHLQGHFDSRQLDRDFDFLNRVIGYGILTPRALRGTKKKGAATP